MNDLRKAAEQALEALEDIFGKEKKDVGAINALRQALAHEALDRMVAENQMLGLYDYAMDWEAVAADQAMTIAMMKLEKREWVGLTTAEVIQCQEAYYYDTYKNIEAKLKEKNS